MERRQESYSGPCQPVVELSGPLVGYDNEFVDPPPDALCCLVCALPYREPHLLGCCGKKICEPCIERVRLAGKPCPFCNQPIATMLDKELRCRVLDLKVFCLKKDSGCRWQGELRDLQNHTEKKCNFVEAFCRYQCGRRFPRCQLDQHEHEECPHRPLEVKFEGLVRKMEGMFAESATRQEQYEARIARLEAEAKRREETHKAAMEAQQDQFSILLREQEERHKRKMEELATATKQGLQAEKECRIREITGLRKPQNVEGLVNKLDELHDHLFLPPHCWFTMPSYSREKKKIIFADWYSPPFYSGPGGYKMCLNVDAYGSGTGTQMSVFVQLMRGEHDSKLKWPFHADVTVQLVNQKRDQNHYSVNMTSIVLERVTSGERAKKGKGRIMFITHTDLEAVTESTQYLLDDTLRFRIPRVVVHSS